MSGFDTGLPHPEFAGALKDNEVAAFCDGTLWPAVNFLARQDFVQDAPPRSEFYIEQTVPCAEFLMQICVTATIDPEYDDPEDVGPSSRVCSVSVTSAVTCSDMLDNLLSVARIMTEADSDFVECDELGLIEAWKVTTYCFDDEDFRAGRDVHYELRDLAGSELWSEEDIQAPKSSDAELTDEQTDILERLDDTSVPTLESDDLVEIRFLLSRLGVPEDIIE